MKKKLNERMRQTIIEEAVNDIFQRKILDVMTKLTELVCQIHREQCPVPYKLSADEMAEWINFTKRVRYQTGLDSDGNKEYKQFEIITPVPQSRNSYYFTIINPTNELLEVHKQLVELVEEQDKFQANVRHIVFSCNTVKQLMELMPSMKKYCERYADPEPSNSQLVPVELIQKVSSYFQST